MELEELEVYEMWMVLGEKAWGIVSRWDFFAKDVVGKQFARSADSVAANLSEGFGRYFYKENRQFCYYARGSLYETKTWPRKAHGRGLVEDGEFDTITKEMSVIGRRLNADIKSIGQSDNSAKN